MAKRGFRIGKQRQSTLNRSVRQGMAPVQIRILNPWEGFTPDVSYHGLQPSGTSGWRGLMVWGEYLLTRDGFEAVRDGTGEVSFGFDSTVLGYDEAVLGGGTIERWADPTRAGAGAERQPVAVIGWFYNDRTNPGRREAFVITNTTARVTAGSGGAAPFSEYNGFFLRRLDQTDTWGTIQFTDLAATADTEDSPPRWTTDEVIDWALFPQDISDFTPTAPYVIFCAKDPGPGNTAYAADGGQSVMVYPSMTDATTYTSMAVAAAQLEAAAGVSQDADVQHGIGARSVTVFDSRAMYLNTLENLDPGASPFVNQPRRVRWSAIGHPFLLDPGYENSTGTIFGVGAGFMDLDEWEGEGVRIEVMGRTAVACYLDTGVAFLRRTGRPEQAFEREIISQDRGLLATRALVNIGQGIHFGIFTDGWFFLDESGQWREVGLAQTERQSVYKWKETFYEQLIRGQVHKLAVAYDPLRKMIQVAWCAADVPTGGDADELNTVWYYDLTSDRVYENTYTEDYADDMTPRAWAVIPPDIHEPNVLAGTDAGVVAEYLAQANERIVVHGDATGRCFAQDVLFHQYNQENIAWDFELKDTAFGLDPFVMKTVDRMWFEYETVPNDLGSSAGAPADANPACVSFNVTVTPDNGTPVGPTAVTLQAQADPAGEIRIAEVALRALGNTSGHRFLMEFEGSGNVKFLSIRIQVLVAEERGIGSHAKTSGGTAI